MGDESSVRVALRVRPLIARELIEMCRVCTSVTPGEPQVLLGSDRAFTYDYVFDTNSSQSEVYESCVECLIEGCFEGYNATVLAYGQTGSGKTFTMGTGLEVESGDMRGIIPRAVAHLFSGIEQRRTAAVDGGLTPPEFKVTAYFLELYNEEVVDLLDGGMQNGSRSAMRIHEDLSGGIYVTGITTKTVLTVHDALQCLHSGALSRTTGSTNMNTSSSRSHAIYTLLIQQQRLVPQDADSKEIPEFETLTAKFHFVDLAGSERLKRTGATGERAREGISINCGLLALGNVISALGDVSKKSSHVPYRDSKLTRLLQDSLGGNSRTLMIACVSPSDTDFMETLNTLKYANRARNIKNKIMVNQDRTSKTIAILRQEIQQLQIELMEYRQGKRVVGQDGFEESSDIFVENQMLTSEGNSLRTRLKALQETVDTLTVKNTSLLAEKAVGQWIAASEDSDMTSVIHSYIKEIEELRTKLCESEHMCQQLRKQVDNKGNALMRLSMPSHALLRGHLFSGLEEAPTEPNVSELLQEARRELLVDVAAVKEKELAKGIPVDGEELEEGDVEGMGEDSDSSLDSADEEDENYNKELAELTSEISIKQQLIESLELSQRRLETLKKQYEEKLNLLMNKIKTTQDERDKVLSNMKQSTGLIGIGGDDKVKVVKQEYERKICTMQQEMKKLQTAQKEHGKLMRERTQFERQLQTMKGELGEMKRTKVKLMNKMKEDTSKARQVGLENNRVIAQLRKATRKQENYIKSLEAENRLKNAVLKRKTEEIVNLRRAPPQKLSDRAAGKLVKKVIDPRSAKFLQRAARQKWQALEQTISKVAYNKQTVHSMERDMDRWLKERESLCHQLERILKRRDRVDSSNIVTCNDLSDQVEAIKANIDYIHENIQECQENIISIEENKDDPLEAEMILNGMSNETTCYLVNKLIGAAIGQATLAAHRQATIGELEGKMKQMHQTTSVQEQLLAHVLSDKDMEVYSLMSSLVATESLAVPQSAESSRSNSPYDGRDKARCKTATTQEMLFSLTDSLERNGNEGSSSVLLVPSSMTVSVPPIETGRFTWPPEPTNLITGGVVAGARETAREYVKPIVTQRVGIPRVISAPNAIRNQANSRSFTALPTATRKYSYSPTRKSPTRKSPSRKSLEMPESPRLTRKNLNSISSANLNLARPLSAKEPMVEPSPPNSPGTYRRSTSREENVFSRLTSTSSSFHESRPDIGIINPSPNRINQRSVLACTHVAQGHSKAVLALYATDELLFSASKDRTIKVWDLVRGQEVQQLSGHPNNVTCVKFSESQQLCFSVSSSAIRVWDIRENPAKCTRTLSSSGLTTTPGTVMSTSGQSRTLQMPQGETQIHDIAISTSSNLLYSAASNFVRIWDLRKFQSIGKLSGGHQAAVMCLAVDESNPDQDLVITGSKDHYIKVFDVNRRVSGLVNPRLNLEPPHYDGIQSLAVDGDTLFSGSRDMCIKKWNLQQGELVQSLNGAHKDWICALCFLPGGQIVLSGCRGGVVKMWSSESCHLIGELKAHSEPINSIRTNSHCIFTASRFCG